MSLVLEAAAAPREAFELWRSAHFVELEDVSSFDSSRLW